MRKRYWKFKHFKYINGIRGAISLFLAVIMTPFLTIAMALVETGRYNSAVSVLDEAMGISSTATLANYDEYLHKRWGLLAADQGINLDALYGSYLSTNAGVLGSSLTLENQSAEGIYPLGDPEILESQILEFSKLNAPTLMAENFLNLSYLIDKLEELGQFDNIVASLNGGVGVIDSTVTLVDYTEDLVEDATNLDAYSQTYEERYTAFSDAVNDLIEALGETRPDGEEDPEGAAAYDANINTLRINAETARTSYSEILGNISETLSDYKTKMTQCQESLSGIGTNALGAASSLGELRQTRLDKSQRKRDNKREIERMQRDGFAENDPTYQNLLRERDTIERELAQLETQIGVLEAASDGGEEVTSGWQDTFESYDDAVIGTIIQSFDSMKTSVDDYSISFVTSETASLDEMIYHSVAVGGYISASEINSYLTQQEQKLQNGSLSALLEGMTSFYNSIFQMTLLYDPELSAYLDVDYYNQNLGGLPGGNAANGGVIQIIHNIADTITAIRNFKEDLSHWKFGQALLKLKEIIVNIVNLFEALVQFACGIVRNILDLFQGCDRLYYSTYVTFNLSCRTDDDFKCMTGYTLEDLPEQEIVGNNGTVFDDLVALIDAVQGYVNGSGDDITFSGAELEYILYGSNSEVANQLYTFCALYLIRFLLDIAPVVANTEVQELAAATTFGYPVVIGLEMVLEPLIETIFLVNGESFSIYDKTVFLTPTGLPTMINKMISVARVTAQESEVLKEELVNAFGATMDDYEYQEYLYENRDNNNNDDDDDDDDDDDNYTSELLKFNYREYCFMLLLLTVTKEQQLARLQNLIQTETLYYYQQKGVDYTFDLRSSYTYLRTEADVKVKQMLPALIDSSLFEITREQYRGY